MHISTLLFTFWCSVCVTTKVRHLATSVIQYSEGEKLKFVANLKSFLVERSSMEVCHHCCCILRTFVAFHHTYTHIYTYTSHIYTYTSHTYTYTHHTHTHSSCTHKRTNIYTLHIHTHTYSRRYTLAITHVRRNVLCFV